MKDPAFDESCIPNWMHENILFGGDTKKLNRQSRTVSLR